MSSTRAKPASPRRDRSTPCLVVGVLAVCTFLAVSVPLASSQPESPGPVEEADAVEEFEAAEESDGEERDTSEAPDLTQQRALARAISTHPDLEARIGHLSLDDGFSVFVPIVNLSEDDQALLDTLAEGSGIGVFAVPALMSASEGRDLKSSVQAALEAEGLGAIERAVGVDESGLVKVAVLPEAMTNVRATIASVAEETADRLDLPERARTVQTQLEARALTDAPSFDRTTVFAEASAAVLRDDGPILYSELGGTSNDEWRDQTPVQAARWAHINPDTGGQSNGICTFGFNLKNPSNTQKLTTAGHCWTETKAGGSGNQGSETDTLLVTMATASGSSTGIDVTDTVNKNVLANNSTADLMVVSKVLITGSPRARTRINDTGSSHLKVRGQVDNNEMFLTDEACLAGWGLQKNTTVDFFCDDLSILDQDLTVSGITVTNLVCTSTLTSDNTHHAHPGDSGGPWWSEVSNGAEAMGWHKGRWFETIFGSAFTHSCFSTIENGLDELGAGWTLWTE